MKRTLNLLFGLALLLMQACQSKNEPEPTPTPTVDPVLKVSTTSLSFTQAGGSQTVQVTANNDWTASADGQGITVSPTSGKGDATVTITAAAASSGNETNGSVTFKSKGLSASVAVKQEAKTTIQVGAVSKIPAEGGTFTVDIQYNTEFTVEVESAARSWITFVKTRALTSGKLEFSIAENKAAEARTGKVTVKDNGGKVDPIVLTFEQEKRSRKSEALEIMNRVYEAWGAQTWTNRPWTPGEEGPGFSFNPNTETVKIWVQGYGVNREVPDCIGDFGDMLTEFHIVDEPGVTGSLPDSFRKLTGLEWITLESTGMTSLPDVFGDMKKLKHFEVHINPSLAGPLPRSLQSPVLEYLNVGHNLFSGSIPDTWAPYSGFMSVYNNCLSGKISHLLRGRDEVKAFLEKSNLWQKPGYGFDISDLDMPGYHYWFEDQRLENLDGTTFSIPEVVKQNKYTVYIMWALWCPFSKELMPALKRYYDKYKQDGLEVIATIQVEEGFEQLFYDYPAQKAECIKKGYDQWYNYYFTKYSKSYFMKVPVAEVYDQDGNVLFSSFDDYSDPVRKRYGKTASSDLIPFLETLLGPAEIPDTYESTDYSKDGEVMTMQTASVGKGIDLVFLGDAYTDRDMGRGGLYEKVMKQSMEEFFAIEPYKSFRNRFNVYAVKAVSKNARIGDGCQTALSVRFGNGSYVEGNNEKCYEYAMKVPGIKSRDNLLVTVLVNSRRHAGTTFMYANGQTCVAYLSSMDNDPSVFGFTLRHEAGGHGFAFLADEYSQYAGTPPAEHIADYNDAYSKYGWYSNVDFTNDPQKIRWSAFLADDRYKNEVGIYEGGALYEKGAYRPTPNSMMREDLEYFNAPSRWAIYQQIMKRSGESPSFDAFLTYDAVNRKSASQSAKKAAANSARQPFVPTAPPVIVK